MSMDKEILVFTPDSFLDMFNTALATSSFNLTDGGSMQDEDLEVYEEVEQ